MPYPAGAATPSRVDGALAVLKQRGACGGGGDPAQARDTEDFFPVTEAGVRRSSVPADIQALCDRCPVREECFTYALAHGEQGIWGGTTEAQREAVLRTIRRKKCPACESRRLLTRSLAQVCCDCGTSWVATTVKAPDASRRRAYRQRIRAPRRTGATAAA